MSKIGGLGKGLDALLGGVSIEDAPIKNGGKSTSLDGENSQLILLDPHLLDPNPQQPRTDFDEEALKELSESIKEHGVVQPIIAEAAEGGRYHIVAGERRTRAAIMAGLDKVPVLVRKYDDSTDLQAKHLEIALIENIQRADLNPIEEAAAYQKLMDMGDLSQDELSRKVGKKRSTVANAMRLLNLPEKIKSALRDGTITAGHARAILSLTGDAARMALFDNIMNNNLTVRQAEAQAQAKMSGPHISPKLLRHGTGEGSADPQNRRDADIMAIEQKMLERMGTKCRINGTLQKGKIEMDYYSRADLDRLCEMIVGDKGSGAL